VDAASLAQLSADGKMTVIDRRSLMLGTAAVAAALALPRRPAASSVRPSLFITDTRIPAGMETAYLWRAAGVRVIDRAHEDLGRAWHSIIPNMLKKRQRSIAGLTFWVDSYICETFGREHGLAMQRDPAGAGEVLHGWVLKPVRALRSRPAR
jgi:hypothetical protein